MNKRLTRQDIRRAHKEARRAQEEARLRHAAFRARIVQALDEGARAADIAEWTNITPQRVHAIKQSMRPPR